jgi:hypothetical protein
VKVKEVALWDIPCVNSVKNHSMEIMSCIHICQPNTTPVIYARGDTYYSLSHDTIS